MSCVYDSLLAQMFSRFEDGAVVCKLGSHFSPLLFLLCLF